MKFILIVRDKGQDREWKEPYDEPGLNSLAEIKDWAIKTVDRFNETLRPHEKPRELVNIEIPENSESDEHKWYKFRPMTQADSGSLYDLMKCEKCGIMGKRYGLGEGGVTRESPFTSHKFASCSFTSQFLKTHTRVEGLKGRKRWIEK